MDALAIAHDASVPMIDKSIVRVHQHGACINKIKDCRRIATRYDKLAANYLRFRPACVSPAVAARQ
jgi:transposase